MNPLDISELRQLCQIAKKAAIAAGEYIQSRFDGQYTQQRKAGGDTIASQVVTEVDIKAQQIILDHLQDSMATYDLGLLTEEAVDDQSRQSKAYFWCIDPLDGTLPFTEHRTGYAVSIALISKAGDPVLSAVYIPDLQLCYSAITGEGVQLNDELFTRSAITSGDTLHFYMDRSFLSDPYYEFIKNRISQWAQEHEKVDISYHNDFGGVRNAIGVMTSVRGCYFKFPKERKGSGSIWDYSATRLFFEELGLPVSNALGERLHLNTPQTTFMNHQGALYATDEYLARFIVHLGRKVEGLAS
ncbi:MAG: inositol monophosphatase family protein [Bacteroidota bacterium]